MSQHPVFYDVSGRRKRRFTFGIAAFALLVLLSIAVFVVSIGGVPAAPLLPVDAERPVFHRLSAPHGVIRRARRNLDDYAARLFGGHGTAKAAASGNPSLAIAFHTPWDPSSPASLGRHVEQLDWVIPGWVSVTGPDHAITVFRDTAGRAVLNRAVHRPVILPMVQNA